MTNPIRAGLPSLAAGAASLILPLSVCLFFLAGCVPEPLHSDPAGPASPPLSWKTLPPLPRPLSNNAVAAVVHDGRTLLFSFAGIDSSLSYGGITGGAYSLDLSSGEWRAIPPLPDGGGRVGATAQAVGSAICIFGGFTVGDRLREKTLDRVDIYDLRRGAYSRGKPVPVPVDDAVSGVWRERLVYLIGGWSGEGSVGNVQVYDARSDLWGQATPLPAPAIFGHAGGIIGDTIVICDGVEVDLGSDTPFLLSNRCFRGDIDPDNPSSIGWERIAAHPGRPRYRMAGGALSREGLVVFAGGAGSAYSYSGIGYDGEIAAPTDATFAYHVDSGRWMRLENTPAATMDHRGLAGDGERLFLAGGITGGRKATDAVQMLSRSSGGAVTGESGGQQSP